MGILTSAVEGNSMLLMIANVIGSIPIAFLSVYMSVAEVALYEMASGRLRQRSSFIDEPLRREENSENIYTNEE